MMTQGVMTQTVSLFENAAGNVTPKAKETGNNFELIINNSLRNGKFDTVGNTEHPAVRKTSQQSREKDSDSENDAAAGGGQISEAAGSTAKTGDTQNAAQTKGRTQKTEDESGSPDVETEDDKELTADEETMAAIAGMLQNVKEAVMDILGLSSEELDQLLSQQGLGLEDLLQPDSLQQLVLACSGQTDLLSVLTDENLADTMKQLLQAVEDIRSEAELKLSAEQIRSLLDSGKPSQKNTADRTEKTDAAAGAADNIREGQETVNPVPVKDEKAGETARNSGQQEVQAEVTKLTGAEKSSSDAQADLSKNKSRDLKAAEQFEVFINNLAKASSAPQVDFDGSLVQAAQLRDIASQILERIRVTVQPDRTSMELQLHPENLGKVNLSVQSKNGVMTAQFVVQNEISREAIESQLHVLRETLNQQGIKVDAIEVTVSAYSFDQNGKEQAEGRGEAKKSRSGSPISVEEAVSMIDDAEEAVNSVDVTGVRGSRIDYTA